MDSPIRKQQKRNDYLRHKLFRKINRRRKAEKELALNAPEKELKRRLRLPKYYDGKNIVYETQNTEDGTIYRVKPSAFGAEELNITTPEVVVTTRDPRKAIPTANGLNISDASSELKRRFYDHITPAGYEFPITRTVLAALNPGRVKTIEINPRTRRGKTIYPGLISALRDDLLAEYLQIPKEERHKVIINAENNVYNSGEIEETSLRPTNAENDKYFKFKNLSKPERDRLVRLGTPLSVGSNTLSGALRAYLGEHTIGHGHDAKGDYISYYDKWDLAPFTGEGKDLSFGIGKPVNVYDRIYLDDYYNIPEEYRGSAYIPELTVTAKKYANGKEELPYPLRTSTDYDDNLAYQRGISRDPITGHMWSTTQEEYPKLRIYLKKPNHPTYSKAVWGDMNGGYDVYRKGDRDYAAPTFSELMYTKPPFRYNSGKDSGIHINPKNRGKFNALKKRTGKTTEQLTHSKNPLTRKRAIFALNAAKWRKK